MSELFEKVKVGDQKTIVRTYKRGDTEKYVDGTLITFKKRVKVKVTQEYQKLSYGTNEYGWVDVTIDYQNAIDAEPVGETADLPKARTVTPRWWHRLINFFTETKEET